MCKSVCVCVFAKKWRVIKMNKIKGKSIHFDFVLMALINSIKAAQYPAALPRTHTNKCNACFYASVCVCVCAYFHAFTCHAQRFVFTFIEHTHTHTHPHL